MKLLALFLLGALLFAQAPTLKRPRVALVLEGGGALGFAHIGVIRYLEEHHIPVDLVVGTSMGGLVGGLYAMGNSPAQIFRLTDQINWDAVLGGNTSLQDLNFRRKEDRFAYPNRLEFGLKHGRLGFPSGLNSGYQAGLIFDKATLAYDGVHNFDDLPIPFRCVATDLTAGREKVFANGSLSQALRATMSIPAVFAPVTIDGHVYTDGGAVDNLPVDIARRAGADIVIAVYLDPGTPDPKSYQSPLSVAARNISIMIAANELRSIASADVLISVDLHGITSADFKQAKVIAPKGYRAAEGKHRVLDKFALDSSDWAAYLAARNSRIRTSLPVPQFVEIVSSRPDYAQALQKSLAPYVGQPVNPPKLEQSLNRIVGTGAISSVGYSLTDRNGTPGLEVKTYPKTYGPPFLNLGVTIDGSNPNNVLFGMSARLTFLDLGGYRAEWRNEAFFGSTYGVSSEYYRPFTAYSRWFVAPHIYALSAPFNIYFGQQRTDQYRVEHEGFGVDAGYVLGPRAEIRFGQDLLWFKTVKVITSDPFPNSTERQAVSSLKFRYYGVDNVQVPRRGLNIEASGRWYQRPDDAVSPSFPQLQLTASYFVPISQPASIFFRADGGTTLGASIVDLDLQGFSLGGPLRLGSYGQNELLGSQYFLLQSGYERKLLPLNPFLGEGLYAMALFEIGKVYDTYETSAALPVDGSFALVARTSIGPMFIGASFGDSGHRKWWFGLGRIF